MKSEFRVALVGCGRIAQRHATLLGEGKIPGLRLAGVCDVRPERAEALTTKYAIPQFTDMDEMMASVEPDVVSILTPSGNHAEHAQRLAPYGKHLVVEKPMALTLADADAMIEACDRYGCRLFVVKQNRFNVPVVKLREAVDAGRLGHITMGTVRVRWCRRQEYYDQDQWRGTWAFDGGVLANQASHHIDLLQWMLGDVESVCAFATTALAKVETEDTAAAILRFRDGAIGVIEATTAVRPKDIEGSLSILGEKGTVEIGGFAVNQMKTWMFEDPLPEDDEITSRYSVNPPDVYGFGHMAYYEHIADCLTNGTRPLVDGAEGRRSLEVITAIYEALETGSRVDLNNLTGVARLGRPTPRVRATSPGSGGLRPVGAEARPGAS